MGSMHPFEKVFPGLVDRFHTLFVEFGCPNDTPMKENKANEKEDSPGDAHGLDERDDRVDGRGEVPPKKCDKEGPTQGHDPFFVKGNVVFDRVVGFARVTLFLLALVEDVGETGFMDRTDAPCAMTRRRNELAFGFQAYPTTGLVRGRHDVL